MIQTGQKSKSSALFLLRNNNKLEIHKLERQSITFILQSFPQPYIPSGVNRSEG